ncbi:ribonuclease H-like domain-containing protein [Favolaschia claudopus]|uniref:3'-5' exonuclease n=1 Tax=Favolaschia claudopus TaxID=2862362 RepID=A0AAW0B3A4_9AGAR
MASTGSPLDLIQSSFQFIPNKIKRRRFLKRLVSSNPIKPSQLQFSPPYHCLPKLSFNLERTMNPQTQRFAPDDAAIKMKLGKLGNPKSENLKPYEQQQTIFLISDADEANTRLRLIGRTQSSASTVNSKFVKKTKIFQTVKDQRGKVCTVQLTIHDSTYVLDMTRIDGCPVELRRILEDPTIAKAGTGLHCDGKIISECFSIDVKNCQDLGCMIRIALPISYKDTTSPLSLQQCVADILHRDLKKDDRKADWELGLSDNGAGRPVDRLLLYAALDAQAAWKYIIVSSSA